MIEKLRRRIEVRTFKALEVAPEVDREPLEAREVVEELLNTLKAETKEEVALQSKFTGKRPR